MLYGKTCSEKIMMERKERFEKMRVQNPIIWADMPDPDVLRAVERDLRRQYGNRYRIMAADSGASALGAIEQLKLRNEYALGREDWVLWIYPGVPGKSLVYLCQKNPLGFETDNPYIGQYNLDNSKFYDFNKMDLETWDYK